MGTESCCRGGYRLIMILYALVCALWLGLNFWMMPWHALQVGQVRPAPLNCSFSQALSCSEISQQIGELSQPWIPDIHPPHHNC